VKQKKVFCIHAFFLKNLPSIFSVDVEEINPFDMYLEISSFVSTKEHCKLEKIMKEKKRFSPSNLTTLKSVQCTHEWDQ